LLPESPPSKLHFIFSAPHERRTRGLTRDGHWILY